ncbi:MAG: glycosyltransferase family 4 protein [Pseudonocardiaceae bacterium]
MSRPFHVVIVNPYGYKLFEPAARASHVYGGAEVQLYCLATSLATLPGVRVSMVVERPRDGPLRSEIDGVAMRFVRPSPLLDWIRRYLPVLSLPYLAATVRSGADVVVQRGGAVLSMDAALAARVRRVPFVFMVAHDWDCSRRHTSGSQRVNGASYLWALRRASLVIAQTDDQAELLRRWHRIEAPVMRSGLPAAIGRTERPGGADNPILWVGRCLAWKRPEAFLALAELLPHRQFVMVCPPYEGEEELAERVRTRAAASSNLRFIPFVPFRDTAALFAAAGIYVNTSVAEGFPNTFMQAARAGTPIASLSVNSDDVIRRQGIGVVGEDSVTVLAERVDALLADRSGWLATSVAARRYFTANHDLTVVVAVFGRMLETIVADPRAEHLRDQA